MDNFDFTGEGSDDDFAPAAKVINTPLIHP